MYAGEPLVTGSDVADALLEYARQVVERAVSVVVQIPVLEENGETKSHSLLLGPGSQLDVADVDGHALEPEAESFPVPVFPPLGTVVTPTPTRAFGDRSLENELFDGNA